MESTAISRWRRLTSTSALAVPFVACALLSACGDSHGAGAARTRDGGAHDGGSEPDPQDDASQEPGDDASTSADAGLEAGHDAEPLPEPPPADWDADVPAEQLGKTYAETAYTITRPSGLATAFEALTSDTGDTRVFLNDLRQGDAGAEARYGAASLYPAPTGLIWQTPRVSRTFRVAPVAGTDGALVSEPFTYELEATVPSPLNANQRFRLSLTAAQAVWTANFSADQEQIVDGTLYGVVSRSEAETRPLALGAACYLVCKEPLVTCAGAGVSTLAGLLDCTSTELDVDSDANGEADGYRLAIHFTSQRVDFDAAGL